jgi:hypothetical protein
MIHETGDVEVNKFPCYNESNAFFPLCAKEKKKDWETFFPFHIMKEHLMILVADLDIFYLPFTGSPNDLYNFLVPNSNYSQHQLVKVDNESRDTLIPKEVPKGTTLTEEEQSAMNGWIDDSIIKFMI